ncbi:MAG TPA: GNAT family N-acetyltransferase, partial [Acidimicrobiales bacterium]
LALPEGRQIEDQPLPDGHAIRSATENDHKDVWTVIEDAFLEWSDRDRQPFEDFAAQVMRRPGFQPWNLRVVTDPTDQIVGAAFVVRAGEVGFVDKVAVAKAHRGRGLARALLADAFAQARAHGATASMLSTDSRSGALGLYERVDMQVVAVWLHRSILL